MPAMGKERNKEVEGIKMEGRAVLKERKKKRKYTQNF